jgi:alkylresorcinol/alkylpyrone synthase
LSGSPRLAAVATATPPHRTSQSDAKSLAAHLFRETLAADARLLAVFDHTEIDGRHTCMPVEWYGRDHDFAEKNALYVEHALALAEDATRRALDRAGLLPGDVDHVVFVSSTGLATPSLDARLANVLAFRSDVRRTPIWGLGCAGGAAGLSRARDFALADPNARVLVVALELCSLTFQRNDLTKRNLVAASLFGDGAAAALVTGADVRTKANGTPPLAMVATRSTLWPDSLDVMGWEVDGAGLHVVFSKDIPTIVREKVRPGLSAFLAAQGLDLESLEHVVAHPGGVKVLRAYAEALGRDPASFRHSRDILREYGNMSSPTCLFVLERFIDTDTIGRGEHAVVAALGPGFSSEYVLLRRA